MSKKTRFLINPLLIVGVLLVFASSCKKDDSIPVLSTSAVTDITQTTAISGGNITSDGGATVTARGVCWSTGQTPTIFDNKTTDGTGAGTFVSNISGLEPNTTYYVRAYATNSAGTGYGSAMLFTTLEPIGLPVLSTAEVTEITPTTAVVGGNITDDGGATVTARGVCWSTNQNPTIRDNKTEDGNGAGTFVSKISGLEPNTTYYVRAYATNSAGTGYGSAMPFTTLEVGLPVLSPTEVTEITPTTAVVGGNIIDDGGATVTARGVCWSTNQNPTIRDNKTEDGNGVGTFVSNISGLELNTTYNVRAYATNSKGTGYGSAMSFTTKDGFTDPRDGNVYQTVTIGKQEWMAVNLKYLPSMVGPATGSLTTAYYYVYGYAGTDVTDAKATANYTTYGVLYNWPAAMNACPTGWHLPSDAEWTELTDYLGGSGVAGDKLKEIGTTHWKILNTDATNETGFTALPGGYRGYDGSFDAIGGDGYWWSATGPYASTAWRRGMHSHHSLVGRNYNNKELGLSVRCLRD